jgi:serine kinase of HPr protein (carbohydrate metabolism regulator)
MRPDPGQDASWIHATAVVFGEAGILIRGPSGAGKSAVAIALLELARARSCYGALVSDDRVLVEARSSRILARCAPNIEGLIERRGVGLFHVAHASSAIVRLVVDLARRGETVERIAGDEPKNAEIVGISLPCLTLGGIASPFEQAFAVIDELGRRGGGAIPANC